MDNLNFDINERYELLKEEFGIIKKEVEFILANPVLPPLTDESFVFTGTGASIAKKYFKQQRRLVTLRLKILAKQSYLEKLKASIDMDNADTERDYDNLDIDALLDRVAQYPAVDERKYANLMWLLSEFKFFQKEGNKEAIVFYAKGITELLNGK